MNNLQQQQLTLEKSDIILQQHFLEYTIPAAFWFE
jgi:hypothetical protein